jgi:hypothetical protein
VPELQGSQTASIASPSARSLPQPLATTPKNSPPRSKSSPQPPRPISPSKLASIPQPQPAASKQGPNFASLPMIQRRADLLPPPPGLPSRDSASSSPPVSLGSLSRIRDQLSSSGSRPLPSPPLSSSPVQHPPQLPPPPPRSLSPQRDPLSGLPSPPLRAPLASSQEAVPSTDTPSQEVQGIISPICSCSTITKRVTVTLSRPLRVETPRSRCASRRRLSSAVA